MSTQPPIHRTLFIWPSGLYPRRIAYYMLAKQLPPTILKDLNLTLIPCIKHPTTHKIISAPGHESRPAGYSVPCLRLLTGTSETWIHESTAILEYLEDLLPASAGFKTMLGTAPEQRARTRDICTLVNEALTWSNVATRHSDPNAFLWSGLESAKMAPTAAEDGRREVGKLLMKLKGWVKDDVEGGCVSLSGEGMGVGIADVCLLASVEYIMDVYGYDCLEGFEVLKTWRERVRGLGWFRGFEGLVGLEREGLGGLFV